MLQKKITRVDPHHIGIWQPAHEGDATTVEKLVSNNVYCYTPFVIYQYLLNILQERYTTELKMTHGLELEEPKSVPFNIDVA
jgi:hypothetical protein